MGNARIVLGGTALSTSTERDGTFTLRAVPPSNHVLVASYTGFESSSRPVNAQAGQEVAVLRSARGLTQRFLELLDTKQAM